MFIDRVSREGKAIDSVRPSVHPLVSLSVEPTGLRTCVCVCVCVWDITIARLGLKVKVMQYCAN